MLLTVKVNDPHELGSACGMFPQAADKLIRLRDAGYDSVGFDTDANEAVYFMKDGNMVYADGSRSMNP